MGPVATAYLIGVGPGDPELLTLKAARLIAACDTILHPGPSDDKGFAREVIGDLLRPTQSVRGMALAMRRGPDDGTVGYDRVARALAEEARAGRAAAFLAEGDPLFFGTASHVLGQMNALAPDVPVEVVPGVSAVSAAAARAGCPLAQKDEILTICPATYHAAQIGEILDRPGPSCWLKAADVLPTLAEELRKRGRLERAVLVERVGRADERIERDLTAALGQPLSYFTLVLVR
jgi:precorrin-2/cobalt-factor-2 C20-methyltransferase